jgi:hypothetical protein
MTRGHGRPWRCECRSRCGGRARELRALGLAEADGAPSCWHHGIAVQPTKTNPLLRRIPTTTRLRISPSALSVSVFVSRRSSRNSAFSHCKARRFLICSITPRASQRKGWRRILQGVGASSSGKSASRACRVGWGGRKASSVRQASAPIFESPASFALRTGKPVIQSS